MLQYLSFPKLLTMACAGLMSVASLVGAEEAVRKEKWDYAPTIQAIAKNFKGEVGKVVPMGDSITYANQASKWARHGSGRTPEQEEVARWMRAGDNDARNGWWLAANDQPDNRSWTAASSITSEQYLQGGFRGLPSLAEILSTHKPQIALILLGTNDVNQGVGKSAYLANMERIFKACMDAGAVPVVTTIPPNTKANAADIVAYNDGLYALAEKLKVPFLDLHGEFLRLQPGDAWKATLISGDGVHPSFDGSEGPATEENLKKCGYLVKCYMQCIKVGEIKAKMKW